MTRRSQTSIEIPLEGLLTEPDQAAAERMAAFDALPKEVRTFMDGCPFDFSALQAQDVVARRGPQGCLGAMRASVVGEARRWARERDAALSWARERFRNRR